MELGTVSIPEIAKSLAERHPIEIVQFALENYSFARENYSFALENF